MTEAALAAKFKALRSELTSTRADFTYGWQGDGPYAQQKDLLPCKTVLEELCRLFERHTQEAEFTDGLKVAHRRLLAIENGGTWSDHGGKWLEGVESLVRSADIQFRTRGIKVLENAEPEEVKTMRALKEAAEARVASLSLALEAKRRAPLPKRRGAVPIMAAIASLPVFFGLGFAAGAFRYPSFLVEPAKYNARWWFENAGWEAWCCLISIAVGSFTLGKVSVTRKKSKV
jgi:hypothetical protein